VLLRFDEIEERVEVLATNINRLATIADSCLQDRKARQMSEIAKAVAKKK